MKNLNSIKLVVALAEARSFTIAAHRLGLSPSAISKAVERLERELGERLFNRTTRRVALTESGAALYERFRRVLAEIDDAENEIARTRNVPRGRLHIQMPINFGRKVIVPSLPSFALRYPEVVTDVELSDWIPDMVEEHIDVAIRIGEIADSRLIARKLFSLRYVTCASPAYLETHGEPRVPADLDEHSCLAFFDPRLGKYRDWLFGERGEHLVKPVSGRLNYNDTESLVEAAIAGAGIVTVSTFIVADAIRAGRLRVILKNFISKGPVAYAVYLPHSTASPRVKAFVDFLFEIVPKKPAWDLDI